MAKRKPKAALTKNYTLTMTVHLARQLDEELQKAREAVPGLFISKSAFFAHIMSEWLAMLRQPEREPTLPAPRRRTRPPAPDARAQQD